MSEANIKIVKTFPVGAGALAQYDAVKTPAALVVGAAATDTLIGIVQDGADANATSVAVCIFGITRAVAHAAITKGDLLEAAAAGRLATHSTTSTKPVVGVALETATAQDDEIEIFLFPQSDAGPAA